jgi:hypothetical protein
VDDDVGLKAYAGHDVVAGAARHRPPDDLCRDVGAADGDEMDAVGGAVVGGPIEREARAAPRRQVGLRQKHLAPPDDRERLGGHPAAGIGTPSAVLARRGSRPAGRSIRNAEPIREAAAEVLAGLTVGPQDDRLRGFTEPVRDRLAGGSDPGCFGETADDETG